MRPYNENLENKYFLCNPSSWAEVFFKYISFVDFSRPDLGTLILLSFKKLKLSLFVKKCINLCKIYGSFKVIETPRVERMSKLTYLYLCPSCVLKNGFTPWVLYHVLAADQNGLWFIWIEFHWLSHDQSLLNQLTTYSRVIGEKLRFLLNIQSTNLAFISEKPAAYIPRYPL